MIMEQDENGNIVITEKQYEYEIYRNGASEGTLVVDRYRAIQLYKDYCRMYPEEEVMFTKRTKEIKTTTIEEDWSNLSMEEIEEMEQTALKESLDDFYANDMDL